jgi:hypothetical protein
LEAPITPYIIIGSAMFSILWGVINVYRIKNVKMNASVIQVGKLEKEQLKDLEKKGKETLPPQTQEECFEMMQHIARLIEDGAQTFIFKEYCYLSVFCCLFAIIIYFAAE